MAQIDISNVEWTEIQGEPDLGYKCDYAMAVLGYQEDNGTLDLLVKFAPDSHCHFHRHIAATTTLVLEGEHHVFEHNDDGDKIHKIKPAGTYSHSSGGEVHMERGGPEGATVFYALQSPSGVLFELLDNDQNVIAENTIAEMAQQVEAIAKTG